MITLLTYIDAIFSYLPFLMAVVLTSFALKIYILGNLFLQGHKTNPSNKRPWLFLVLVLISAIIVDCAWLVSLARSLWIPLMDIRILLFPLRLSWGFFAVQYQALTLFIESLTDQPKKLNIRQKLFIFLSCIPFIFSVGLAFININCVDTSHRPPIEFLMRTAENVYLLLILVPISLVITFWKLRTHNLPRILKKQLNVLIPALIIPIWLCDILQMFPLAFSPNWTTNSYSAVNLSTILITCAFFYCARRVVALRFLNFREHVQSAARVNFIDGFKDVLEQLSHATSPSELRHITQTLFKDSFGIPFNKTKLYIRKPTEVDEKIAHEYPAQQADTHLTNLVENFITTQQEPVLAQIAASKILIYDEIAFSNFYEQQPESQIILSFLESIDADIFLPIYEKNHMIAYIIVEQHARPERFYGNIEHDEMLVFSSYLGNIINLLQTRNLKLLLQQEKELKEELYHKHQEINQYKESIRSFLRTTQQKEIGIIFYKNRNFIFGNKAAKDLIQININAQEGHPLTKTLKHVARQVEEYKAPYTSFAQDKEGNKLVLAGVPNLEHNNVIITVYHPEISDIIKRQIDLLQDPSKWDYLLYLETTTSGKLINQLIPGSGEKLLNFKITLLKLALSKKAILLEMPEEDLIPTVEIINHVSLRETLHVLKLHSPSRTHDIAIKLFGINPLFGINNSNKPLLEQLNDTGTLFIQNIHFLDLETQEYLAEFIKYGTYRTFKSDQKIISNVRIICSTNQNLQTLVHEGTFSAALFNELKRTTLSMPSLLTLSEDELGTLADGFIEQAIKTHDLKNLLELTDKEKLKLAHHRPVSLQELREKVQLLLINKSKKNQIYNETQFDPAYQLSDPQLIEAARLGKHALRDPKLMAMLWDKFKSQAKIATFLGVNRSSVNRRCKDFKLTEL